MSLCESFRSVKFFEKLIDEWNDPKDIAQRSAVMLKDVHQFYARVILIALQMIEEKSYCKHPKKMRNVSKDGTVYCMNCNSSMKKY